MASQVGVQDIEQAAESQGAWLSGTVAASPTPTTTTFALNEYDIPTGTNLAGALVIVGVVPNFVTNVQSNSGGTLTLANALPAAPPPGTKVLVFPQININAQVTASQNLAEWANTAVAAPQGDADGVAASASGLPVIIAHLVGWTGAAWNRLKLGLSGGLVIQKPSALQNYVPSGTSAAASTPLLVSYGNTKAHFTPPDAGTMRVAFALSASVTVSMTRNAAAATPTYDALNSGAAVPAASELAFDIPVDPNDAIDFEISAAATVNVFKLYFIYGS